MYVFWETCQNQCVREDLASAAVDSTLREKTLYGIDEDRDGSGGSEADKCQMAKTEGVLVTDHL